LGYTEAEVVEDSVFFPRGERVLGHEFHYSMCVADGAADLRHGLRMIRGQGSALGRDGFLHKNTWAGYNHIHALAVPGWADRFVAAAADRRRDAAR
jgi:cobyrinic acid a,c-diamide synthase